MSGLEDSPTADWWCWTTNEPSTFRCRELGHDVRPRRPMPFERPVVDTLSTSARLALTEQELVEAQDETRRLRDQLGSADARIRTLARAERERDEAEQHGIQLMRERDEARAEARDQQRRRLEVAAELASARQEIEQLRGAQQWIVARDGGRDCERCEHEIRRGEAYELLPGVDELQHIHCPDLPLPDNQNGAPTAMSRDGKNYVQRVRDELVALLPDCDPALLDLYTLLALEFGSQTDAVMVHNAWSVWRNRTDPGHRSLIPFPFLAPDVQELDRPYVQAIHKAGEAATNGLIQAAAVDGDPA